MINKFLLSYLLFSTIQTTVSDIFVYNNSNKVINNYEDQNANFGPSFPSDGLKGYITITNPPNACQKILPPPNIPTYGYRWIALIPRTRSGDSCEFMTKVQNAQNANFSAVIIYNYEDTLVAMGSSSKNVHIPSTLITHTDGLTLISHYLYNETTVNSTPIYHLKILPEEPFKFGIYLIPFVVVIGVSFLGLIGFVLVKYHLQRRRMQRHRLPRSALKQLKIKKFVKTDPWEVCVICLDDFEEGAKLRILPCDHAYHVKCIDPWLINNRRQCPVCKRYVFPNQHNSDEESSDPPRVRVHTEQTPLIHSNDTNSTMDISQNSQSSQRHLLRPSTNGVRNISFTSNESSESTESLSTSSRPTTTTEIVFERPSTNVRRYGSLSDSSTTTRRAVDTNASTRSNMENISDIEQADDENDDDDDDERMESAITTSRDNPAYNEDEVSTKDVIRTVM
ncbi:unnamed protein product [Adineta steineri]|uniref:RING-type E3 ubiquitin transferase n=1 Tax=Adineta steineri TaxID=433720 RepID=A0A815AMQ4_9BILA|nr:unnamed protein product [Adineta steineri]CAF1547049.1 unnamed protein product [Adineta steineri]